MVARVLKISGLSVLALVVAAALLLAWGQPPAQGYGPASDLVVLAAGGQPLALVPHKVRRAGPWLSQGQVPPLIAAAALAAEDRRFYHHPGVDPLAIARAAWQNLMAGRIKAGGSTITMQLARLLDPGPRTLSKKLKEAAKALWLTARLGRDGVLRQYLNRAPFGGPLVGIGAASQHLLARHHSALAPDQAALLMALPQDPSRLLRTENRPRLRARRDYILRAMAQAGAIDRPTLARALAAPLELRPLPPEPLAAPHFVRHLAGELAANVPRTLTTHIDPALQREVTDMLRTHVERFGYAGMRQGAALVVRNRDLAVLAWVGSVDFSGPDGQVDGVLAKRQPGSAIKPFLYGLALEKGWTLASRLNDQSLPLAVDGGTHRPVDYDGKSRGAVSLKTALASSLNLPALALCQAIGPASLLARLNAAGLGLKKSADHYGVGLALGDGEVSLYGLTRAYAALARGGELGPLRLWRGQPSGQVRRIMEPRAAYLLASALADDAARAPGLGRRSLLMLPFAAAVKTGTSQQHRDLWCLGFTRDYTVGVWCGDFSGAPLKALSGAKAAAPLWRRIMLRLHRGSPGSLPLRPPGIKSVTICPASGAAAGPSCPAWTSELFASDALPPACCPLHQPAPRPKGLRLTLLSPGAGGVYALDPDIPLQLQMLALSARADGPVSKARWRLDGVALDPDGGPLSARVPLTPGRHHLELAAQGPGGRATLAANFTVLGLSTATER